ncbi:MAG: pyridoxamine 5'-phosphate oxidase family protein [Rhodothermales bacterium]|nr:pyridoxamine 5'-phosphate oxidase family protein [Rhodothermales bacterium]
MAKRPTPEPVDPAALPALAAAAMKAARFPMLATCDGDQPRLRPVSPVRTDGFTVYVANLRSYGKTAEIAACPNVELCYLDAGHDQVRITGTAEVVSDRALLEAIWAENPLLRQYLGSLDNPALIVYRIRPRRVRFMREWALDYHEVPFGETAQAGDGG